MFLWCWMILFQSHRSDRPAGGGNADKWSDRLIKEKTQFNFISCSHPSNWVKVDNLMINTTIFCWIIERGFYFIFDCLWSTRNQLHLQSLNGLHFCIAIGTVVMERFVFLHCGINVCTHETHCRVMWVFNLTNSPTNVTGAARNITFTRIEQSLSRQIWLHNRNTCPALPHKTHPFSE